MLSLGLLASLLYVANDAVVVTPPPDVRGYVRGAAALAVDPASVGMLEGGELSMITLSPQGGGLDRFGLYAAASLGPLAVGIGYDDMDLDISRIRRASLSLAAHLGESVSLGIAYRYLYRVQDGRAASAVDLSLLTEPRSWLSLSVGVDSVNAPALGPESFVRGYRAGVFFRPLAGSPVLSVGGDTRFDFDAGKLADSHVLADCMVWNGIHAFVAYAFDDHALWAGMRLALGPAEVVGAGAPAHFNSVSPSGSTIYGAVTMRTQPRESLLWPATRTIEVPLEGDLRAEESGFLLPNRSRVSSTAYMLEEMARDPTVNTVILSIGALQVGLATVEEIRAAIFQLRAAGKTVVAELMHADEKAYMVAAAANHIRADNLATFTLNGFAAQSMFLTGALAKIGVRFDAVAIGRFKTAPDQLTRTSSRDEDREVLQELIGQATDQLTQVLTSDRHLTAKQVDDIFAKGIFTAAQAKDLGLVDELTQPMDPNAPVAVRTTGESWQEHSVHPRRWASVPEIRVVPIRGTVVVHGGDDPLPGEATDVQSVLAALEDAMNDSLVLGVVLRIESPGGDVAAADMMWRAIRRFADVKPIVASMGDVAASGGYYVAAPTHLILAQPNTITGSIGIFSLKLDVAGLLKKLDVNVEVVKKGEHADWESIFHPLTDADRERVRLSLAAYYDTFVAKVAAGRKMTRARVEELAQGRVYTGADAVKNGLADRLGGLGDAVAEIRARAHVPANSDVHVTFPRERLGLAAALLQLVLAAQSHSGQSVQELVEHLAMMERRVWALWPGPYQVVP